MIGWFSLRKINDLVVNITIYAVQQNVISGFSECGGIFNNASGIITSPSYPHPYPHNAECIFVITQPSGTYVKLDVISIDISCHDAGSDYLEFKDGGSEDSPLRGILWG